MPHQNTWTRMAWLDRQQNQFYKLCSPTPYTQQGEVQESFSFGIKIQRGCVNQHYISKNGNSSDITL